LGLSCRYLEPPKITEVPPEPPNPRIEEGRQVAQQYAAGRLMDYEVVWKVYDLDPVERGPFLDGFVQAVAEALDPVNGTKYQGLLEEAVGGNQFRVAVDLGSRHAAKAVTNEQIQGVIRSSLGVSEAVSLGWKAGYIRGFAAQQVAERAATASVNEQAIQRLHVEAAAMYHALRAAVGR
jgi:hypothetical protein